MALIKCNTIKQLSGELGRAEQTEMILQIQKPFQRGSHPTTSRITSRTEFNCYFFANISLISLMGLVGLVDEGPGLGRLNRTLVSDLECPPSVMDCVLEMTRLVSVRSFGWPVSNCTTYRSSRVETRKCVYGVYNIICVCYYECGMYKKFHPKSLLVTHAGHSCHHHARHVHHARQRYSVYLQYRTQSWSSRSGAASCFGSMSVGFVGSGSCD